MHQHSPCFLLQLNPHSPKTSHTPQNNKPSPELQVQGFKPLEKTPPYPHALPSHFLSAGPATLKGAGDSAHYTTTKSGSLIPVSAQQRRCQNIPTANMTCTNPADRATTKPGPASPLAVISLWEALQHCYRGEWSRISGTGGSGVCDKQDCAHEHSSERRAGHAGGTSHLLPGQSPPFFVPSSWRKGPSLTACAITARLQWGTSQEPSCLQQRAGSRNKVCVSWTYCLVLLQTEASHPQQLSELPVLLLSFLHLWTFQNMQSFHQDTRRLFSLQSSPHLHSLLPQGCLHPESTEKAKHLVTLSYPWPKIFSFLYF